MFGKKLFLVCATLGLCTAGIANNDNKSIGVVNFSTVIQESKMGKHEQASFEALKTQMTQLIEESEKKINELQTKFNDSEFMDGLSPEGEDKLKNEYRKHTEELSRYQNQYYQALQQANMKVLQSLSSGIQEASDAVAKNKKLSLVLNKEACFYYNPSLDVTNLVVTEMDKAFDQKSNKISETPKVEAPAPKTTKPSEAPKAEAAAPKTKGK